MSSQGKRREIDLMKLMRSSHAVEMIDEEKSALTGRIACRVKFLGPAGSNYEGGVWYVNVDLPADYPYRSPSIGFNNHIYHPNIDFRSGSVCLDVINQTWSPMYDLVNIFEVFLPQLLSYPNPSDPLNGEAASLLLRDEKKYQSKVKELVKLHASPNEKDNEFGVKIRSKKTTAPTPLVVASSVPTTNSIGIGNGNLYSSYSVSSSLSSPSNGLMMNMGSPSNGLSPFATTSVGSLNSHSNITMFANGIGAAGDLTRQSSIGSTFSSTSSSSCSVGNYANLGNGIVGNGNQTPSKDQDMNSDESHGEEEEDLAADMEL